MEVLNVRFECSVGPRRNSLVYRDKETNFLYFLRKKELATRVFRFDCYEKQCPCKVIYNDNFRDDLKFKVKVPHNHELNLESQDLMVALNICKERVMREPGLLRIIFEEEMARLPIHVSREVDFVAFDKVLRACRKSVQPAVPGTVEEFINCSRIPEVEKARMLAKKSGQGSPPHSTSENESNIEDYLKIECKLPENTPDSEIDVAMSTLNTSTLPNIEPEYGHNDSNICDEDQFESSEATEEYQDKLDISLNTSEGENVPTNAPNPPNAVPIKSEFLHDTRHLNRQLEDDWTQSERMSCTLNEDNEKDDDSCYLEFVATQLKKIVNRKIKAVVRKKINDIFFQLEMGTLYEDQSQNIIPSPPSSSVQFHPRNSRELDDFIADNTLVFVRAPVSDITSPNTTHTKYSARSTVASRKETDRTNILNPTIFFEDPGSTSTSMPTSSKPTEYDHSDNKIYIENPFESYKTCQNVVNPGLNVSKTANPSIRGVNPPYISPIASEFIKKKRYSNNRLEEVWTHSETIPSKPAEDNDKDEHSCYAQYVATHLRKISNRKTLAVVWKNFNDVIFQLEMGTLYEGQSQIPSSFCSKPTVVSSKERDREELDNNNTVNTLNPNSLLPTSSFDEANCDLDIKHEYLD